MNNRHNPAQAKYLAQLPPFGPVWNTLLDRLRLLGTSRAEICRVAELGSSRLDDQIAKSTFKRPSPEVLFALSGPLHLPYETLLLATWAVGDRARQALKDLIDHPLPAGRRRRRDAATRQRKSQARANRASRQARSDRWDLVLGIAHREDSATFQALAELFNDGAVIGEDPPGRLRISAGAVPDYPDRKKRDLMPIAQDVIRILRMADQALTSRKSPDSGPGNELTEPGNLR